MSFVVVLLAQKPPDLPLPLLLLLPRYEDSRDVADDCDLDCAREFGGASTDNGLIRNKYFP